MHRQLIGLERLQTQLEEVRGTIAAVERGTTPRDAWRAEHTEKLERAVGAGRELSWRSRAERRAAEAVEASVEPRVVTVEPPAVERGAPCMSERSGGARYMSHSSRYDAAADAQARS